MTAAIKTNAPPRVSAGGVLGVQASDDVRRDSRGARPGSQLLTDSRSRVIAASRAAEARAAPVFSITSRQIGALRRIAAKTYAHRDRLLKALAVVELTAADAFTYLDTQQPHARLNGLRQEGFLIFDRWVLVRTDTGSLRRVKAYRLVREEVW